MVDPFEVVDPQVGGPSAPSMVRRFLVARRGETVIQMFGVGSSRGGGRFASRVIMEVTGQFRRGFERPELDIGPTDDTRALGRGQSGRARSRRS